jgi:CHAD domain-containing protein
LAIAADPEAIHTMRVELTRLRAAVLFFSPITDDVAWLGINQELRWLNSALGEARDDDVTASYLQRRRYHRWAKRHHRRLLRAQERSHQRLAKDLDSKRYDRLMFELSHWTTRGAWLSEGPPFRSEPVHIYAQARLHDWTVEISRAGQRLRALRPKELHHLRIECKRYRYVLAALQALGVIIGREELAFEKATRQAHQALGDLRDLKRLRNAAHDPPPGYRKKKRKLLQKAKKAFRCRL